MVFPRQTTHLGGNSTRELKNCQQPDDAFLQLTEQLEAEEGDGTALVPRADVEIETYIHVIAAGKKVEDGWVSVCLSSHLSPFSNRGVGQSSNS